MTCWTLKHGAWPPGCRYPCRLQVTQAAHNVQPLDAQMLAGEHGIVADVRLPPAEEQAAHDLLHLDFALGCPGTSRGPHPSSGHDLQTCQAMQSAVQLG